MALVSVWKPVQVRNFTKIRRFAKRLPSARVVKISQVACKSKGNTDLPVRWNPQLLPESIAPYVLRLAILHPGVLENFLPRFFVKASDFLTQKSTYRRAILILHAVPRFGWSDEKHTKMLIELGALDLLQDGSEVETVKKFIRDLRRRYQKYLNEKAQASA